MLSILKILEKLQLISNRKVFHEIKRMPLLLYQQVMRIAVLLPANNTTLHAETGAFITQLFLEISKTHPEHQYYLICNQIPSDKTPTAENIIYLPFPVSEKSLFSRLLTDRFKLPSLLRKIKADVFVGGDGFRWLNHPIAQSYFSEDYSNKNSRFSPTESRWISRFYLKRSLKKTKQLMFPSTPIKELWEQQFPFIKQRTSVIPVLPSPFFRPLNDPEKENIKATHTGGFEYFICTGAALSGKQMELLLKAFSGFKKRLKSSMKLLMDTATAPANKKDLLLLDSYRYRNDVVLTDLSSAEKKATLTAAAYGLLSVSGNEKTGLSITEAFCCEVPVIAAESAVEKEKGVDAVLYFKPEDRETLSQQMMLLFKDEALRSRLIIAGKATLHQTTQPHKTEDFLNALLPGAGSE